MGGLPKVVRGASGALYLGANIEFPGEGLGQTVHAEQAALSNAFMHDEPGIARNLDRGWRAARWPGDLALEQDPLQIVRNRNAVCRQVHGAAIREQLDELLARHPRPGADIADVEMHER